MSSARFDVKDHVAVVTGGGRGIGFAIARTLAQAGARIVLAEIDPDILKTGQDRLVAEGHDTTGLVVDVTDAASVETLVDTVMARFGRVDILVNSAGIFRVTPAIDVTDEEWRAVMEVNSSAVFRAVQILLGHTKIESTVRYLGVDVDDALTLSERTEI